MNIAQFLSEKGATSSAGEARKLISAGGIWIDEIKVTDTETDLDENMGYFVKVGKTQQYFLLPDGEKIKNAKLFNPDGEAIRAALALVGEFYGPLVVKEAATITGNYRSTDSAVPAVWIWTEQPVTITGCNIECAGNGIHYESNGQPTIFNNYIKGLVPSGDKNKGRAVYCYKPQYLICHHNTFDNTGGGVFAEQQNDKGINPKIKVLANKFINMDKRKANPMDFNGIEHKAGIMLSSMRNIQDGEIAWNEIVNEPGKSWVEDLINILNGGGTQENHLKIHDNYLDGAYPFPTTATSYTGSGITIDGNPSNNTLETTSKFIDVYNNQVIRTGNALWNIAAGHDIKIYNNTGICSGKYPDGTPSNIFWGGFCIYDGSSVGPSVFINNVIENNTVGYVRPDRNVPYPGRQDYVRDGKTPAYVDYSKNNFLPNPITKATEDAELPKWKDKLTQNKVTVGNSSDPIPETKPDPKPTDNLTFKIGQVITGKITPLNAKGQPATFKAKTVKVVSSAPTKVSANVSATDETTFTITPKGVGTSTVSVSFSSNGGKVITKKYTMTIEAAEDASEAVDMKVEFTVK